MINQSPSVKEKTRRERRIERQRLAIMNAAAGLFAQKGYPATTTKDIAKAVDLGESTLYGYFSSKQEVLQAILTHQAGVVDSLLAHLVEIEDRRSFVDLVDLLMEKILAQSVYTRVVIAEAWIDDDVLRNFVIARWLPIMTTLKNFIIAKNEAGIFRSIDPDLGTRMIVAAFIAGILPSLRGTEPLPTPEQRHYLAETIVEFVSDGFYVHKR
jgi:AcrR family transcriptional regulator